MYRYSRIRCISPPFGCYLSGRWITKSEIRSKSSYNEINPYVSNVNFGFIPKPTSRYSVKSHSHILKMANYQKNIVTPQEGSKLANEIGVKLANMYKDESYNLRVEEYKVCDSGWECIISVKWPSDKHIAAVASNKKKAFNEACTKWIQSLQENGLVDNNFKVIALSMDDITQKRSNASMKVNITPGDVQRINRLNTYYESKLVDCIQQVIKEDIALGVYYDASLATDTTCKDITESEKNSRNEELANNLQYRAPVISLPVDEYRDEVISVLQDKNRVVVIEALTGSGKSTRIPSFILDEFTKQGRGTECNILACVPRRLSAKELAARVSAERNELLGSAVGYSVKMENAIPSKKGSILYATTGVILQRIRQDPNLSRYSHIILDEIHERKADMDQLLLLLKKALVVNQNLRVILMSATLDVQLFQQYFNESISVVNIPGRLYDVQIHYFDEEMSRLLNANLKYTPENLDVDFDCIEKLVLYISSAASDSGQCQSILCFLPRISDISTLQKMLNMYDHLYVTICHSKISTACQKEIFLPPPSGKRKVVLATNLAEVSLTIPDVVWVIDTGLENDVRYDENADLNIKKLSWITKSNADQRKGRAGRTSHGVCYRLYSQETYNSFAQDIECEIRKISLEDVILNAKMFSIAPVREFLSELIEPPDSYLVEHGINKLKTYKVLDENENLTLLGKRVAPLMCGVNYSILLLYGAFLRCIEPVLTTVAYLNDNVKIYEHTCTPIKMKQLKLNFAKDSDYLAVNKLFTAWNNHSLTLDLKCDIDTRRMSLIRSLRNHYGDILKRLEIVDEELINQCDNNNSECDEIFTGILIKGLGFIFQSLPVFNQNSEKSHGLNRDQRGRVVVIKSESVTKDYSPNIVRLFNSIGCNVTGNIVLVPECNYISPLAAILFYDGDLKIEKPSSIDEPSVIHIQFSEKLNADILCESELIEPLMKLRNIIQEAFQCYIRIGNSQLFPEFDDFLISLFDVITTVLKSERVALEDLNCGNVSMDCRRLAKIQSSIDN